MFSSNNINQMLELAKRSSIQLNQEIAIFDKILLDTIKNAPEDDKSDIERVKALATKAINLAKMGKAEEAQQVIKDFQHEHQGTRKNL